MKTKFDGRSYVVETLDGSAGKYFPMYLLYGEHGARYGLIRVVARPERLFAVNHRDFRMGTPFDGRHFTDAGGKLRLL